MSRATYVIRDGKLVEKHLAEPLVCSGDRMADGPVVLGDAPDFVSPIDGSIVRGRAGIREHCKRHDVVPTEELKGLSPQRTWRDEKRDQEARKQMIANQVYRR